MSIEDTVTAIRSHLMSEFEVRLFDASLLSLTGADNPLRFNNFAYSMRELTRHFLHRLAPDSEVRSSSWYRNETQEDNGITRRQRMIFAVQGGLSDDFIKNELELDAEDIHSTLVSKIKALSKFTHIEENVFNIGPADIVHHLGEVLTAVLDFFQTIQKCREDLIDKLNSAIDETAASAVLHETIIAIDEISQHHSIEEIWIENVKVKSIDSFQIIFDVRGTLGCQLSWGSSSDFRKGDGATIDQDFPFTCELWSPVENPQDLSFEENTVGVDISSWTDGYYDERDDQR